MVPFRKDRNRLHVAMLDPRSVRSVDEMRFITGFEIVPYCISELRLLYALERYYGMERDLRFIGIFGKEEEGESARQSSKEHLRKIKEHFAKGQEKEEIIGILLTESAKIAPRAAIFIVKGPR